MTPTERQRIELNSMPNRQGFQVRHGEARKTKEYQAWSAIKGRCMNSRNKAFKDYGGRGINVHPEWVRSYKLFLEHVGRAPSPKHSLDRIDNNGNYEPGNVRWATSIEQKNNTRWNRIVEYKGQLKTLSEWCRELNVNYDLVECRLNKYKWNVDDAFETPRYGKKQKTLGKNP